MAKYTAAYTDSDEYIHVESLTEDSDRNKTYYCLGCGSPVVFAIPKTRVKHFKHKNKLDSDCPPEHIIHFEAKKKLFVLLNQLNDQRKIQLPQKRHKICEFAERNLFAQDCEDRLQYLFDASGRFKDIRVILEKSELKWAPNLYLRIETQNNQIATIYFEITLPNTNTRCITNKKNERIIEFIITSDLDISEATIGNLLSEAELHNFEEKIYEKCRCHSSPVKTYAEINGKRVEKKWQSLEEAIKTFGMFQDFMYQTIRFNSCENCNGYIRGNKYPYECWLSPGEEVLSPERRTCPSWKPKFRPNYI